MFPLTKFLVVGRRSKFPCLSRVKSVSMDSVDSLKGSLCIKRPFFALIEKVSQGTIFLFVVPGPRKPCLSCVPRIERFVQFHQSFWATDSVRTWWHILPTYYRRGRLCATVAIRRTVSWVKTAILKISKISNISIIAESKKWPCNESYSILVFDHHFFWRTWNIWLSW